MPHIIFKGIELNEVKLIEKSLVQAVSRIIDCPVDQFTVEWMSTQFISQGNEGDGAYPFVTINWFKRTQEQQDEVAKIITKLVMESGFSEVCVYFNELIPNAYYENGEHF